MIVSSLLSRCEPAADIDARMIVLQTIRALNLGASNRRARRMVCSRPLTL
jgi:hypothetical protein